MPISQVGIICPWPLIGARPFFLLLSGHCLLGLRSFGIPVVVDIMDNDNLATALESQIQINIELIGMARKPLVEPIVLAKRWGITPEKAQKTIQATMQRGVRTIPHPSLSRQFRTNDRNLCYCCLAYPLFSDMMFTGTVSRRGKRYAQVYAMDFGWDRAFPMACRSEAHETLLLLFARDGVLHICVCDNAKEMIKGKFHQKLKDDACHLKQVEPLP